MTWTPKRQEMDPRGYARFLKQKRQTYKAAAQAELMKKHNLVHLDTLNTEIQQKTAYMKSARNWEMKYWKSSKDASDLYVDFHSLREENKALKEDYEKGKDRAKESEAECRRLRKALEKERKRKC